MMSTGGHGQTSTALLGTLLGRYRLEHLLGVGGMGVVYAARHEDLGKTVAVKVLNERYAASAEVGARFLREGQTASRIRHPNIVDVYDVGSEAGRAYLVMELLHGEDLRGLLDREVSLATEYTADLLLPVVSALAAAHDLGVIHRDLKPDNVFLSVERNGLAPKVLDFGISKVIDEHDHTSLTGTGALLGSPYYMSPEQVQATKNVDARSDLYSIGVLLYECVTGRKPVEEPSLYQLIQRIAHGDFVPPRELNPSVCSAFEQLIMKAMALNPAERFPNARALGRALLPFASQRVRANYNDEFERDAAQSSMPAPTPSTQEEGLGTTLSQSVHERDSQSKRASRWATVLPGGGAFILVLGVIVAVVRPGSKSPPKPAPTEAHVLPVVASSPPLAKTLPQPIVNPAPETGRRKRLLSKPDGAHVWIAGEDVGQTPFPIEVPLDDPIDVELRLTGFEPQKRGLSQSDPEEIVVKLLPKPEPTKSPKRTTRAAPRPELAPR